MPASLSPSQYYQQKKKKKQDREGGGELSHEQSCVCVVCEQTEKIKLLCPPLSRALRELLNFNQTCKNKQQYLYSYYYFGRTQSNGHQPQLGFGLLTGGKLQKGQDHSPKRSPVRASLGVSCPVFYVLFLQLSRHYFHVTCSLSIHIPKLHSSGQQMLTYADMLL